MTSPADDILLPLPRKGIAHALVLFDEMPSSLMTELTKRLRGPYPNLQDLDPKRWAAASEPRPISFGELLSDDPDQGWKRVSKWHLLIDSQGVAPEVKETVLAGPQVPDARMHEKLEEAQASVLVFLLSDGSGEPSPMAKMRSLCRPVWELMRMGGTGVAFPEGGTLLSSELLLRLSVDELSSHHSYLFCSNGLQEKAHGKMWFRTHGMGQFGLPDLCHGVPEGLGDELEDELSRTRLLLETLPPEMIAQGGVLPVGGEVSVGPRVFRAVKAPEKGPSAKSRFGFSFLE